MLIFEKIKILRELRIGVSIDPLVRGFLLARIMGWKMETLIYTLAWIPKFSLFWKSSWIKVYLRSKRTLLLFRQCSPRLAFLLARLSLIHQSYSSTYPQGIHLNPPSGFFQNSVAYLLFMGCIQFYHLPSEWHFLKKTSCSLWCD